jgi:hypothetical protein
MKIPVYQDGDEFAIFVMSDIDYISTKNPIQTWLKENKLKLDSINTCVGKYYNNDKLTRTEEVELIITIKFHKKRSRKNV